VNSIIAGATQPRALARLGIIGVGSEYEKQMIAMTPLGRVGQPSDIAPIAVFLASERVQLADGGTHFGLPAAER